MKTSLRRYGSAYPRIGSICSTLHAGNTLRFRRRHVQSSNATAISGTDAATTCGNNTPSITSARPTTTPTTSALTTASTTDASASPAYCEYATVSPTATTCSDYRRQVTSGRTRSSRNRVIPPEEDVRRLFQECKVGKGNANLLSEALKFAKPEELKSKDIIKVCTVPL